jgi:hypothetical protein
MEKGETYDSVESGDYFSTDCVGEHALVLLSATALGGGAACGGARATNLRRLASGVSGRKRRGGGKSEESRC